NARASSITLLCRGLVQRRAELLLVDGALRAGDERLERVGVAHGDVGQHFAVDGRAGGLQSRHQLRVRNAVQARGGVDAGNPQLAEVTLAILAAGEREVQAALDLLLGDAVTARLHPVVALGELQDLRAAVLAFWSSFDAWHGLSSFLFFRAGGSGRTAPGS